MGSFTLGERRFSTFLEQFTTAPTTFTIALRKFTTERKQLSPQHPLVIHSYSTVSNRRNNNFTYTVIPKDILEVKYNKYSKNYRLSKNIVLL